MQKLCAFLCREAEGVARAVLLPEARARTSFGGYVLTVLCYTPQCMVRAPTVQVSERRAVWVVKVAAVATPC